MMFLKSLNIIIVLLVFSIILIIYGFKVSGSNHLVQEMGGGTDFYSAIAAFSGAFAALIAAISGAVLRWIDYKKALVELEIQKVQLEGKKRND